MSFVPSPSDNSRKDMRKSSIVCVTCGELIKSGEPYHRKEYPDETWPQCLECKDSYIKASEKQIGGDHYKSMAIEPSEFIERNNIRWCAGNAIKYICRHHIKGGKEDVEKAIHYLELLLQWTYD